MGEEITNDKKREIVVESSGARNDRGSTAPEGSTLAMTRQEAETCVCGLSIAEKTMLNELLKALEQKRRPSQSPLVSTGKVGL